MCAIVDANVAHEVFGSNPSQAGEQFFGWIEEGNNRLVVGGKLFEELEASSEEFRNWARQAIIARKMKVVDKKQVDTQTKEIEDNVEYKSNDPHVLALAQVSGARLLYSNDGDLQEDFRDKNLIDQPRGKVYSTRVSKNFQPTHKRLLADRNLCRPQE
ncbi:MAG: PIN domain-containing protein [Nitrospinae bacterium]|nr:PIN domain-containing protein [Nitrospinota bacterium]